VTLGEEEKTDDESSVLPHTWIESERFVPRRFVRPVQRILAWESTAGIATLGAAIVALVWANGPFGASYFALWATPASVRVGDVTVWDGTMRSLVNDVAMTVFFFVVTVSIKQQVVAGDLRGALRCQSWLLPAA
jgi:NhaA family Na+:H+ antiporter